LIEKIVQLKQALNQRTGCIILGKVNSGKTFLWNALKKAMISCGESITSFAFNPKGLPRNQLFGKLDSDTGDWTDGVITALVRTALLSGEQEITWLVCDGEIDPEWIESLNSVLDDNRLLTLPTGERLCLGSRIKFIFETRDLSFASPATISRNAIICMKEKNNNLQSPIMVTELDKIKSWVDDDKHFILVGPFGCGKDTIIGKLFSQQNSTEVWTIVCNNNTVPHDIVNVIEENSSLFPTPTGSVYRPLHSKKIVLVLKDIECVRYDKYGDCSLLSFLHHWFDYGGFYDENNKFIQTLGIQVVLVSTLTEAFTSKRTPAFERLQKNMKVGIIDFPKRQDTIDRTCCLFTKKLSEINSSFNDEDKGRRLVETIVDVLHTVSQSLKTEDACYTPFYILNNWVENLAKYDRVGENMKECFAYETRRSIENLVATTDNKSMFLLVKNICRRHEIDYSLRCCFIHISPQKYSLVSMNEMRDFVKSSLQFGDFNENFQLGDDVLHSFSDIQHALHTGSRNVLLLGQSGSGRKTLINLACQTNSVEYSTPMITTKWDTSKFRIQLQQILIKTGIEEDQVCFHIEEFMLTESDMITMVCQILSEGDTMLSTFFDLKQLKNCLSHMHSDGLKLNMETDFMRAKQIFMSNIRDNLNLCISLDLPPNQLNKLLKDHPPLKRNTETVYMRQWDDNSLKNLIRNKCEKLLCKISISHDIFFDIVLQLHRSTEEDFASSLHNFITLIDVWSQLFSSRNEEISSELSKFRLGLKKLSDTNDIVAKLKMESKQVEQNVIDAQSDADKAMTDITSEMTQSQLKMNEAKDLKATVAARSKECIRRKEVIEDEIALIRPVLESSQEG
jgi:DNA replication protein DnaC